MTAVLATVKKSHNDWETQPRNHGGWASRGVKFSERSEKELSAIGKNLLENVVSTVKRGTIKAGEDGSVINAAASYVEKNFKEPAKTKIGDIDITKQGIVDSLSHGFGKTKLDAIPAIKDVLEKGEYLGYEKDFGGKSLKNHYFAGRVSFPDGEKIVFCRVHESETGGNKRFYVHEVFTEEEIKNKGASFKTGLAQNGKGPGGRSLYNNILYDAFNVNKSQRYEMADSKKECGKKRKSKSGKSVNKSWCWFDKSGNFWIKKSALEAFIRGVNRKRRRFGRMKHDDCISEILVDEQEHEKADEGIAVPVF